jgi:hypothetical protein
MVSMVNRHFIDVCSLKFLREIFCFIGRDYVTFTLCLIIALGRLNVSPSTIDHYLITCSIRF